ncbi:MAG TPA: DNA-binding response regulator, partial [Verrucomicrobiae bacterium]|nr:DNA-binding response regulator [Verrucomicrobiae bacterium]
MKNQKSAAAGSGAIPGVAVKPECKEIRILIVDDHVIIRQGLKQILADAFTKAVFGEAKNGA